MWTILARTIIRIDHVAAYLWATANALLGETAYLHRADVGTRLFGAAAERRGAGRGHRRIGSSGEDPTYAATQRQVVRRTVDYDQCNRPYLCYDEYLARGWPIGTGVVEGACGHLVKDHMEQSGTSWTTAAAQAVLDLRGMRLNGQWDIY